MPVKRTECPKHNFASHNFSNLKAVLSTGSQYLPRALSHVTPLKPHFRASPKFRACRREREKLTSSSVVPAPRIGSVNSRRAILQYYCRTFYWFSTPCVNDTHNFLKRHYKPHYSCFFSSSAACQGAGSYLIILTLAFIRWKRSNALSPVPQHADF